jgi:DNA-binding transcriptional LysR family regulator
MAGQLLDAMGNTIFRSRSDCCIHGRQRLRMKRRQAQRAMARGQFVFRSNSYQAILEATLRGQGIALIAEPNERSLPGLVRLEVDAELPQIPIHLVYHREVRRVPRVRLVVDALIASLRDALR